MKWRFKADSSKAELQVLRKEALEVLQSWGITAPALLFEIDLILCELLANAAEHGNHWDATKKVSLNMRFIPVKKQVLMLVCDEGQKTIKKTKSKGVLSERGRGLILLGALASEYKMGCGKVWIRKEIVDDQKNTNR